MYLTYLPTSLHPNPNTHHQQTQNIMRLFHHIRPYSLFNNNRCQKSVLARLAVQLIYVDDSVCFSTILAYNSTTHKK